MTSDQRLRVIGKSVPVKDARQKVCGTLRYPVDVELPGMLHGAILRSEHPHARIRRIDASRALAEPGVVAVVTHEDSPGEEWCATYFNYCGQIFDGTARFVGDEIGAVAATSRRAALDALELIDVEYEVLPAVFDADEAMRPDAPQVQEVGNERPVDIMEWGDLEAARDASTVTASAEVFFSGQQMCPMGRNAAIAEWTDGAVTLYTGTQTPSELKDAVAQAFALPRSRVRVMNLPLGASFGEFWSNNFMLVACLLARKAGRPVKIELSNLECMAYVKRRHKERCRVTMGATAAGDISFIEVHDVFDNGGYGFKNECGFLNIDLWGARATAGRWESHGVSTNLVTAGCMRGVGDVTMGSVIERVADQIAEKCGLDPLEFRIRTQIRPGDTMRAPLNIGQLRHDAEGYERLIDEATKDAPPEVRETWPDLGVLSSGSTVEILRTAADRFGWREKFVGWGEPYAVDGPLRRAVGVGTGIHCCGDPFEGTTDATVRLMKDGSVKLYCSVGRQGNSAETTQAMVAAEALGIDLDLVSVEAGDTDACPHSRGSVASTTMMRTGYATWAAALDAKRQLLEIAGREVFDADASELDIVDGVIFRKEALQAASERDGEPKGGVSIGDVMTRFREDTFETTDSITGRPAWPMPPSFAFARHFAAHFVDLEVDVETGVIRLLDYLAAQDSGTAVHPAVLEGQVLGAAVCGAGFALSEHLHFTADGRVANPSLADYKVLRFIDFPVTAGVFLGGQPDPIGPFGARSAGEAPIAAAVPAVAQAVYNAIGVWVDTPMTPERVLAAARRNVAG